MQNKVSYEITELETSQHPRRGVAFLISGNKRVTAKDAFDGLNQNTRSFFSTRFDQWVQGKQNDKWYHGWSRSEFGGIYTNCYVFKSKEKKLEQRLYGFLCHPIASNQRYLACILINHAVKKQHETDTVNLKDVEEIRTNIDARKAVNAFFEEIKDALDGTKY